ncbi:ictacalcin-like [Thalassophryne amazonica]|uniref:ictacalcin-like n=1 Tax=Thalassophryne amazonica TaxID=390379 RepID=UPI001471C0B5|nr:ictacalcin-like [Thalassophryne amazonica]XP_034016636.1 ictacalcin-like [Thalassophryne amazonica]
MMSDIEKAMTLLISSFHKYSGKEGDKMTLTKGELKDLLESELEGFIGKCADKAAVDQLFEKLDRNQDNTVDFSEFVSLITCLTVVCHEVLNSKN